MSRGAISVTLVAERESATTTEEATVPEYAVVFTLSTDLTPREAAQWAAELAEAREHLLAGERIELAGVTAAEPTATVPGACRV